MCVIYKCDKTVLRMHCGGAVGEDMGALDGQLTVLRRLSNMCQMHPVAMNFMP